MSLGVDTSVKSTFESLDNHRDLIFEEAKRLAFTLKSELRDSRSININMPGEPEVTTRSELTKIVKDLLAVFSRADDLTTQMEIAYQGDERDRMVYDDNWRLCADCHSACTIWDTISDRIKMFDLPPTRMIAEGLMRNADALLFARADALIEQLWVARR